MQSKENQSHIPESDGGVKDEPWAESLAILSQPAGDGHRAPSTDAPGMEGT